MLPVERREADPAALERVAAPSDRVAHWRARLAGIGQDQQA